MDSRRVKPHFENSPARSYRTSGQCRRWSQSMHDLAIAAKIAFMRSEFRAGLFVGIAAGVAIALYCAWLWQGEREVARQTQRLFHAMKAKDWSAVGDFIA